MKKTDSSFLDRVILHNKNADERLFDLILRSVTFIVLIIIVWLYADLVHVKADTQYNNVVSFVYHDNSLGFTSLALNDIDYQEARVAYPDIPSGASFQGIGAFDPLITSSMDLDNNFVILGGTPSDQYAYFAVFLIPKDVVLKADNQKSRCLIFYVLLPRKGKQFDHLWISAVELLHKLGSIVLVSNGDC